MKKSKGASLVEDVDVKCAELLRDVPVPSSLAEYREYLKKCARLLDSVWVASRARSPVELEAVCRARNDGFGATDYKKGKVLCAPVAANESREERARRMMAVTLRIAEAFATKKLLKRIRALPRQAAEDASLLQGPASFRSGMASMLSRLFEMVQSVFGFAIRSPFSLIALSMAFVLLSTRQYSRKEEHSTSWESAGMDRGEDIVGGDVHNGVDLRSVSVRGGDGGDSGNADTASDSYLELFFYYLSGAHFSSNPHADNRGRFAATALSSVNMGSERGMSSLSYIISWFVLPTARNDTNYTNQTNVVSSDVSWLNIAGNFAFDFMTRAAKKGYLRELDFYA